MFQVKDDVLVERIAGRMIHQSSGRTYHEGMIFLSFPLFAEFFKVLYVFRIKILP